MGLRLQGIYDDRSIDEPGRRAKLTLNGSMDDLLDAARKGEVDVIYITLPMHAVERIRAKLLALMDTTASVYLVPDFFVFGLMESRITYFDDIPTVTVTESPFVGIEGWTKRVEDLVVGVADHAAHRHPHAGHCYRHQDHLARPRILPAETLWAGRQID